MELYGYAASILMGSTLGLVGAGGSILVVPILVYLFALTPLMATTQSLFIVGATALVGSIGYLMKGEIKGKAALLFIVPSFVGVYLVRVLLLPIIPHNMLQFGGLTLTKPLFIMSLFSVLMIAASVSMIKRKVIQKENQDRDESPAKKIAKTTIAGFLVGGLTSLIGAGGGFLIIPSLVVILGLKMREAVGTSLIIIASNSLFGFFTSYQKTEGAIDWMQMMAISAIAIAGIFIGTFASKRVPETSLKRGFGYFVLLTGAFILWNQIQRLQGM